jgi:hypothetical protein
MNDCPTSFLLMVGLLGSSILGGIVLLVCISAAIKVPHRRQAIRTLYVGILGGGFAFVAAVLWAYVVLSDAERQLSLLLPWGPITFLAGLAWIAAFSFFVVLISRLRSSRVRA